MKKLIIIFFLTLSVNCFSQYITDTVGTTKQNLVTVYNTQESASISTLGGVYQWVEVAIYCDSTLKVSSDSGQLKYVKTKAGQWNYLGKYRGSELTNLYFKKFNSETTTVTYTIILWGIK